MKKAMLLLCAVLMTASAMKAQMSFTVKGACDPSISQLLMFNLTDKQDQGDTISVKDGKFTATKTVPENSFMYVTDRASQNSLPFIADAKDIYIDLRNDSISGSAQNEKFSRILAQISKTQNQEEGINIIIQAIEENKDNYIPAFLLSMISPVMEYEQLKLALSPERTYSSHPLCDMAKMVLQQKEADMKIIGKPFIDLEENDINGKPHKLSEFVGKGNYVLIDFWASWCGPCMAEMPNVKANYEKYKAKGFNVIGLSLDRSESAWKECIKKNGLNWTHLSDLKFWQSKAAEVYEIKSIPQSILCDGEGKIVARNLRGDALGNKLQQIYGF